MNHEKQAQIYHASGYSCEQAVFGAYAGELGISHVMAMQQAPRRRDRGATCGAYTSGKRLLERLRPEAVDEFTKLFTALNGSTDCYRLQQAHRRGWAGCTDVLAAVTCLIDALLNDKATG